MAKGLLHTQTSFDDYFKDIKVKVKVRHLKGSKIVYSKKFSSGNPAKDLKDAKNYIKNKKIKNLFLERSL